MFKGWRTIGFNILIVAAAVVAFLDQADLASIFPYDAGPYILLGIGIANILLRMVTTTPVGQSR